MPRLHHSHSPQEFDCQPRPTRWPTLSERTCGADGGDGADDFVAGNEGILADAPVVGNQVKVAMTNAAVGDADFDFLQAQFTRVVAKRQKFGSRRVSCKSLNLGHGRSAVLAGGRKKGPDSWAVRVRQNLRKRCRLSLV